MYKIIEVNCMLKQDKTYRKIKKYAKNEFSIKEHIDGYSSLIDAIKKILGNRYTLKELKDEKMKLEFMTIPKSEYKFWIQLIVTIVFSLATLVFNFSKDFPKMTDENQVVIFIKILLSLFIIAIAVAIDMVINKLIDNHNYYVERYNELKLSCLNQVLEIKLKEKHNQKHKADYTQKHFKVNVKSIK